MSADARQRLQASLGTAYVIERELGGGGMSHTYLAHEAALGRKVVVKMLSPEMVAGVSVDRFKREIQLAAGLQHPHIVPVLSAGDADGLPWFTMPYVEGESLRIRLARGPLRIGEITGILKDVARALEFAHGHGVVHRDIKPDNVLLAGSSATVTDFGIAKALSASRAETPGATLTMAGTSIGTPTYMAPEQAAGDPTLDHRSDIYSFGVMAYELLAGRPPFTADSPVKLMTAHFSERARDIREMRADVPPALADLVMRCLEKDARDRPQTAADVVRVLDTVTSSGAAEAAPTLLRSQMRLGRAVGLWAGATALVALTAWAATTAIGLPDWVFPGSLGVMMAGLPMILGTWYVQKAASRAFTATPAFTPGGTVAAPGTLVTIALKASPHLSWRRTWMGGAVAVGAFATLVIAFMVLRALGIGPAASLIGAGQFGAREKLVVADFRSPASDTTLGPTVAEAIRTDLAQSANLSVLTRAAIRDILQLMQRPVGTPLEFPLAREIATREGAKAVLDGEIVRLGASYVVSARLVASLDGRDLATFRGTAGNENELVSVLGKLSRDIREKVGESLKSIREAKALERVTTSSLPALRKYVDGMFAIEALGDDQRGQALLREAVALDTSFAMAWRRLAASYAGAGRDRASQMAAIEKAYQFRDRLSDNERLVTEAGYFSYGPTPDLDRVIAAYEALLERDSLSNPALNNGGTRYGQKREFAKGEALLRRATQLSNPFGGSFTNLIQNLISQGKYDAADSVQREFERVLPSHSNHWESRFYILTARGNYTAADSLARAVYGSAKTPRQREFSAWSTGALDLMQGRLEDGLRWNSISNEVAATQSGTRMPILRAALDSAWVMGFYLGDAARSRDILRRAVTRVPLESLPASERPWSVLVRLAAVTNDAAAMKSALAGLDRDRAQMGILPGEIVLAKAVAAMAEGKVDEAIAGFREADRMFAVCRRCTMIDLARAFDLAGRSDSAIVYFQRFIDTPRPFLFEDIPYLAGSHKRIAELYDAKGDVENAIRNYSRFVELWRDADPELQPQVKKARDRLAELMRRRG